MSEDVRPIVVKRIKKVAGGHHGGAWKIAYADFMTAMMAFFLLMWLLGSSTSSADLKGISDFFQNPMKVAMLGGSGADAGSAPVVPGTQPHRVPLAQALAGAVPAGAEQVMLLALAADAALQAADAADVPQCKIPHGRGHALAAG